MQPVPARAAPVQPVALPAMPAVPAVPDASVNAPHMSADGHSMGETMSPDGQVKKTRNRQNFTWRQVSVLEQVFETDPLPWPVSLTRRPSGC